MNIIHDMKHLAVPESLTKALSALASRRANGKPGRNLPAGRFNRWTGSTVRKDSHRGRRNTLHVPAMK